MDTLFFATYNERLNLTVPSLAFAHAVCRYLNTRYRMRPIINDYIVCDRIPVKIWNTIVRHRDDILDLKDLYLGRYKAQYSHIIDRIMEYPTLNRETVTHKCAIFETGRSSKVYMSLPKNHPYLRKA